jgi:hypothetical protein
VNTKSAAGEFDQIDDSKNLSQLIRSNAPHYWKYMKSEADPRGLEPYLSFEGMLAGDPHMGNFAGLPLKAFGGGPRQMKYVNVDFDDAGRGPFVLDFIRYVIAAKTTNEDVKKHLLQEVYLMGLAGKQMNPPKKVRELLAMSVSDYDDLVTQYTEKKSTGQGFIFKEGEIQAYDAKIARSTIEKLFANEKVVDLAIRPRERGGSAGELRIWILVEGKETPRRIMELKQHATPGTANYQAQPPVEQWLREIRQAFWPGLDGSAYDLVDIAGSGLFWIRQKEVSLIDVPYSSEKNSKIDYLDDLVTYDANQLGLAHGRQAQAPAYRAAIERDNEAFHDATASVEKAYLELAKQALAKKGPQQNN